VDNRRGWRGNQVKKVSANDCANALGFGAKYFRNLDIARISATRLKLACDAIERFGVDEVLFAFGLTAWGQAVSMFRFCW
jgi:hypothetical protein